MTFEDYQTQAQQTAGGPSRKERAILGLLGEAGEVAECCKKHLRGDYDEIEFLRRLRGELGDLLWYLAETCVVFGFSLEHVARLNLMKLRSRASRGVIGGSGSDR